jgi:NAD(P)-dependent dehydrogenase (short-subunit alcohol dehydrogenase family)
LSEFERLYQLNTLGALRVTQAVLPAMRQRGSGRIILVSSILGRFGIPLIGGYAQSKWALEAIAETLALEVGPLGIEVAVLEPAMVSTAGPRSANNYRDDTAEYAALWERLGEVPAELAIAPEQVARAIADTVDAAYPPLRAPVGAAAEHLLAALDHAPTDQAFDTITAMSGTVR